MRDLRKVVPPSREILKGIWLSFYPGAKIGVLGGNGAGKAAAADHGGRRQGLPRRRRPRPAPGSATCRRSRCSTRRRTCAATSRRPCASSARCSTGSTRSAPVRRADRRRRDGHGCSRSRATCRSDRRARPWDLDRKLEIAMDAMRLPAGRRRRRHALRRRAAPGGAVQAAARAARHAAARRADQPPRRRERRLARAPPGGVPGTVVAVTHDRYFLDNVAGWILELDRGEGIPWQGNYSSWLEQKQDRLAQEEKQASARQKTLQRELEWVRMAPRARLAKSKARITALRGAAARRPSGRRGHAPRS